MKSLAQTLCNRSPLSLWWSALTWMDSPDNMITISIKQWVLLLFGQITESMKDCLRWSKWQQAVRTRFIIKMWQMVWISWYIYVRLEVWGPGPRHLAQGLRAFDFVLWALWVDLKVGIVERKFFGAYFFWKVVPWKVFTVSQFQYCGQAHHTAQCTIRGWSEGTHTQPTTR